MSWRTIVISNISKLDYQMGYMVVRSEKSTRVHLSEVNTVIIENTAVSLTCALLCELVKQKIKVIFCDEKRNPLSELMPYYGSHDTSSKVKKQIAWKDDAKQKVWTEIVREKLKQQSLLLQDCQKIEECNLLIKYIEEIQPADATNREGHAAKVYFNALFGTDFTRGEDISINSALNYGYSILLSMFNREIVANGYITQLGICHKSIYNQFNLTSDLMEPFRIIVDRKVLKMELEKFETEEKRDMINFMKEQVIINSRSEVVTNAVKIYCKSVFDAIEENDVSLIKFYRI